MGEPAPRYEEPPPHQVLPCSTPVAARAPAPATSEAPLALSLRLLPPAAAAVPPPTATAVPPPTATAAVPPTAAAASAAAAFLWRWQAFRYAAIMATATPR